MFGSIQAWLTFLYPKALLWSTHAQSAKPYATVFFFFQWWNKLPFLPYISQHLYSSCRGSTSFLFMQVLRQHPTFPALTLYSLRFILLLDFVIYWCTQLEIVLSLNWLPFVLCKHLGLNSSLCYHHGHTLSQCYKTLFESCLAGYEILLTHNMYIFLCLQLFAHFC